MMRRLKTLWRFRKAAILILTPLLLLPVPISYTTKAGRCLYGLLIMAVFWMTEPIPMEATALLPVVLFPLLGVASSKELCGLYLKDSNMLFLGGFMVVVAVEKWNLHKRIALRALMLAGSKPRWLMLGFMVTTAFLSMWISNTATTAMMVPIAAAVLNQLELQHKQEKQGMVNLADYPSDGALTSDTFIIEQPDSEKPADSPSQRDQRRFTRMCTGMMLSICYSANIGGIATLIGTGPNLVCKGLVDSLYGDAARVTFTSWFVFAFPSAALCVALAWLWLQWMYMSPSSGRRCCTKTVQTKDNGSEVAQIIRKEYELLGPMSFAEKIVLVNFVLMVLLWFTREPDFIPGWATVFSSNKYISDTTVSVSIGLILFMLPSRMPTFGDHGPSRDASSPASSQRILDWRSVQLDLSWGVLVIRGGGFALAAACKSSGLSSDVSSIASVLTAVQPWLLLLILSFLVAGITEFVSNVATSAIFLPIVAELGVTIGIHPLYLMLGVTLATSYSFMLPVATAPNTIVFSSGYVRLSDMVKCGLVMNIICLLVLQVTMNTWATAYFDLGSFPVWAGNASHVITANLSGSPVN